MGLTLGRNKGESVIIKTSDGDIEIMSLSNQTKLNITAPKSVGIWRKELLNENNELPPRDQSRTVKSPKQEEQDVCLHRRKPVHSSFNKAAIETSKIRDGMAEVEKMSKCRDARLKKESGHYYMTLWCYRKNMACESVCDNYKDKRKCHAGTH